MTRAAVLERLDLFVRWLRAQMHAYQEPDHVDGMPPPVNLRWLAKKQGDIDALEYAIRALVGADQTCADCIFRGPSQTELVEARNSSAPTWPMYNAFHDCGRFKVRMPWHTIKCNGFVRAPPQD